MRRSKNPDGQIASAIDKSPKEVTGPAFSLDVDVDLGLSDPSFQSIMRNLHVLLT
jgi:putative ATP-dependent endonuclease of OLD family